PGSPSVTNVKLPREIVVFRFAGLLSLSPVCVECLTVCLTVFSLRRSYAEAKTRRRNRKVEDRQGQKGEALVRVCVLHRRYRKASAWDRRSDEQDRRKEPRGRDGDGACGRNSLFD